MSDIYEAAREVRDAINVLDDTTAGRLGDIWTELHSVTEALQGIKAALRDISDVLHAQYYGDQTDEEGDEDGDQDGGKGDSGQALPHG